MLLLTSVVLEVSLDQPAAHCRHTGSGPELCDKLPERAEAFRVCCLGCFTGVSKSVQVLFNGIEAVMVLTFRYHILSTIHLYHVLSTFYSILYRVYTDIENSEIEPWSCIRNTVLARWLQEANFCWAAGSS